MELDLTVRALRFTCPPHTWRGVVGRKAEERRLTLRRFEHFLIIGGSTGLLQVLLLIWFQASGWSVFAATTTSLLASVAVNFALNRLITWRDRFDRLTTRQNVVWSIPLLLVFALFSPSIFLKIIGINLMVSAFHAPVLMMWLVFEVAGAIVNYLCANNFTFGYVVKLIDRITSGAAKERPLVPVNGEAVWLP